MTIMINRSGEFQTGSGPIDLMGFDNNGKL
jgi:hypothetical protein